jgi:hypothetical protein
MAMHPQPLLPLHSQLQFPAPQLDIVCSWSLQRIQTFSIRKGHDSEHKIRCDGLNARPTNETARADCKLTIEQSLPGNLSIEDWQVMREVIAAVRQAIPARRAKLKRITEGTEENGRT